VGVARVEGTFPTLVSPPGEWGVGPPHNMGAEYYWGKVRRGGRKECRPPTSMQMNIALGFKLLDLYDRLIVKVLCQLCQAPVVGEEDDLRPP
jgi:hypothetical protein